MWRSDEKFDIFSSYIYRLQCEQNISTQLIKSQSMTFWQTARLSPLTSTHCAPRCRHNVVDIISPSPQLGDIWNCETNWHECETTLRKNATVFKQLNSLTLQKLKIQHYRMVTQQEVTLSLSETEVNLENFTRKFLHNKFIKLLRNLHFDVMHIRSIIQQ